VFTQVVVMASGAPLADAAMRLRDLCAKCRPDDVTHVWINVKPAGRVLAQVRAFNTADVSQARLTKNNGTA
jgi:hypothetical protein